MKIILYHIYNVSQKFQLKFYSEKHFICTNLTTKIKNCRNLKTFFDRIRRLKDKPWFPIDSKRLKELSHLRCVVYLQIAILKVTSKTRRSARFRENGKFQETCSRSNPTRAGLSVLCAIQSWVGALFPAFPTHWWRPAVLKPLSIHKLSRQKSTMVHW